jgi:hypothetical protein
MSNQKKNKYIGISILLSVISIAISIVINSQIAKVYLRSSGKNKALFGLIEFAQFGYQYYIAVLGIISLILAILSIKMNGQRSREIVAVVLSLLAITIVFIRIWKLFI